MTDSTTDQAKREFFAVQIDRQLGQIADEFRSLADSIDDRRKDVARIGQPGIPNAGHIAQTLYQKIASALANAPVSRLISTAADYDLNVPQD